VVLGKVTVSYTFPKDGGRAKLGKSKSEKYISVLFYDSDQYTVYAIKENWKIIDSGRALDLVWGI